MATAHKIARAFYYMLKHRTPYAARSAEDYLQHERKRELARLTHKAHKLGFQLVQAAPQPLAGSSF